MIQIVCFVLGLAAIVMGIKAFTPTGLEFRAGKKLSGPAAVIAGVCTILLGLAILVFAAMIPYISR